ncbi:secondary carrier transporter [Lithospermum erythrorhizon]|uniref:Secondary carrier transporter n=1 Tax=Lithospermum erythrorhizon TaxID=34254 RepID=A0AAV3R563_LITER
MTIEADVASAPELGLADIQINCWIKQGFTEHEHDGFNGIFRGFGTCAIGAFPGRVLALTSLEVSKELTLKYTEATRLGLANAVAGKFSNLFSSVYFVPFDVSRGSWFQAQLTTVARLMETIQMSLHQIRSLGYRDEAEEKPSHAEMVTVQATAGLVACGCSSIITTPIDTVKTRLQVIDDYGVGRPSVMKTTKVLLREEGWRGFYSGFGPRFLNMSFYGTTMIVTYELIKRLSINRS